MPITYKDEIFSIDGYSKVIKSPFFFPSVSSIQTSYDVYDYFTLIQKTSYPAFLVSAYDLYYHPMRARFTKEISKLSQNGFTVLLDSGHYEAYWRSDKKWTFDKLKKILKGTEADLYFSFDVFYDEKKNRPKEHVKETIKYAAMTAGAQRYGITIPIIHGVPKNFTDIVKKVVKGISPEIIGITERELGDSLLERASNLGLIRKELDKTGKNVAIHLLGTGNTTSLLVYFLCGADFFDALEWCKNVVNPVNGHLYHFAQMDLLDCSCAVCKIKNLPYPVRVTSHNLLFYKAFTDEIREALVNKRVDKLLTKYLPNHIISRLKKVSVRI